MGIDSDKEAVKIVNAIKPFVKRWFEEWGRSCVRSKKMTVTTAPSDGLIGVTDAFSDTECFIKYTPECANAVVGDAVWVRWMYDNMQTLYAESMSTFEEPTPPTPEKEYMKSLWTGSWASGSITVQDITDYTIFLVRFSGQGTMAIAMLGSGNLDGNETYFRGEGGYAASSSGETRYYIAATRSGDSLSMVDAHSVNASNTRTALTVIEIIGVI